MSKYTAEQVREAVEDFAGYSYTHQGIGGELMAIAEDYAALLRERESAKAAVTAEIVKIARKAQESMISVHSNPEKVADDHMRAALEAVAPMLASARVPDERKAAMYADESRQDHYEAAIYDKGWNDCRKAMLAAAPKPETEE